MKNIIIDLIDLIDSKDDELTGKPDRRILQKVTNNQPDLSAKNEEFYSLTRSKMKVFKLSTLFLMYTLYQDDYKLSLLEKLTLRKVIRKQKHLMIKQDKKDIKDILKSKPSVGYLVNFAKERKYSFEEVEKTIRFLSIITEKNERYQSTIKDIHRKFIIEEEYM